MQGIQQGNLPPVGALGLGGENLADNQQEIRGAVTVTVGSRTRDTPNPDSDECFETAGSPGVCSMRGLRVVGYLTIFA